ncbi:Caspase-2 [Strongyloides ratti]|uniref:Caspase-2 n=1 Tax=Strongyloides ratti TaxID=34506 RepID=A0A090LMQ6_STRRB|nr:Caspase-2 [Strongyloides ratti]CEF71026.1 Caspase-2 [Strongyloides ratti]
MILRSGGSTTSSMTIQRRNVLTTNLIEFTKYLNIESVIPILKNNNILNSNDIEILLKEFGRKEQCSQLIRILKTRGNIAFDIFYESLLETHQYNIAKFNIDKIINGIEEDDSPPLNTYMIQTSSNYASNLDYYINNKEHIYKMFSNPKGLALIINNQHFQTMNERFGTEKDEEYLISLFSKLGYKCLPTFRDLKAMEMLEKMKKFSRLPEHYSHDSAVVCVLTHGETDCLYGVDDNQILVQDFISFLNAKNCPGLLNKPKLFFIQACRGSKYDEGVIPNTLLPNDEVDSNWSALFRKKNNSYKENFPKHVDYGGRNKNYSDIKIPIEADILVAYATPSGYVSWRNSVNGSWFIQSIFKIFHEYAATHDILSMLTMVNQMVAEKFVSTNTKNVQMPDFCSRLKKKLYFFPGVISESEV